MTQPQAYYTALRDEQTALATELRTRYRRLALVRLAVFLAWIVVLILFVGNQSWWAAAWFFGTLPVLRWGVQRHRRVGLLAERAEIRTRLAERELAALNHDFAAADGGEEFLRPEHPYALDLDLFGPRSLFAFLNRTVTAGGRQRLAEELLQAKNEEERARTRVQSTEVGAMADWSITFRTLGEELEDNIKYTRSLTEWLNRPDVIQSDLDRWIIRLSPLFALAAIAYMVFVGPWYVGALAFLPAGYLLRKYSDAIPEEHGRTARTGELLSVYAELLEHTGTWERFAAAGEAVPALRKLSYYVSQLDVRYNPFVILLELAGLWSLSWLNRLDGWRARHREDLPEWLGTLAEVDTLVTWGTLRFNRPGWTDAEFTDEPVFEAKGLGHPLLPPTSLVTNDVTMDTDGHIHLVTGSNMAGKSTWLRTVGTNLVLAHAGSPVLASHLRTRPLQVWTSMRTQDDLSEATSSFYAELKRLKAIIEAVSNPTQPVFFLLDEILKGTNSRDRHTGARALIRQLIRERGAGIIATHDLELATLENEPGSRVENYAMEVQTAGDDLSFDYKLHPGVCTSFNATALMARMGIDIPEDEISFHHD